VTTRLRVAGALLFAASPATAQIRVISSGGFRAPLDAVLPDSQKTTGISGLSAPVSRKATRRTPLRTNCAVAFRQMWSSWPARDSTC
jgi:hypothetical protein